MLSTVTETDVFATLLESHSHPAVPRWGIVIAVVLHAGVLSVLLLRPGSTVRAEIAILPRDAFPPVEIVDTRQPPTAPVGPPNEPIVITVPLPGPIPGVPELPIPTVGSPGTMAPSGSAPGEWTVDPMPVSLVQEPPVLLQAPLPAYPPRMRDAGIEGSVLIEAVVDTLGRVEPGSLRIVSSDRAEFAAPATVSIGAALFRPARVFGRPVRVLVRVPVAFRLR